MLSVPPTSGIPTSEKHKYDRLSNALPVIRRAARCIVNDTHCHCAITPPTPGQMCYRPIEDVSGRCQEGPCVKGYKCDCEAHDICQKLSSVFYIAPDALAPEQRETSDVACTKGQKMTPKMVTGRTTDFHMLSKGIFSIFRNNEQFGYGKGDEYVVLSTEIQTGDIMGVVGRSSGKYGMKLRFRDMQDEVRVIDENWRCSGSFAADWLQRHFKPETMGWTSPSIVADVEGDDFDGNVPWMWKGNLELMFCRYVMP